MHKRMGGEVMRGSRDIGVYPIDTYTHNRHHRHNTDVLKTGRRPVHMSHLFEWRGHPGIDTTMK
jgi:hypothetical protein